MDNQMANSGDTGNAESRFRDPQWGASQLKAIGIFRGFADEELAILYSLGVHRSIAAGAHVVIEGDPSRGLFVLLRGSVSIHKNDAVSAQMSRIASLEAGNHFGELTLFDTAPRSATVIADTPCDIFYLDVKDFDSFLRQSGAEVTAKLYRAALEELCARLRQLNADYIQSQKLLWEHALRK